MQIGFNLPISGPLSSPEILTRIAQEGEALGYDYLTLTDHIVLPNLPVPGYPYSESGEFFCEVPQRRHEQPTTAAYIAARLAGSEPVEAAQAGHRLASLVICYPGAIIPGYAMPPKKREDSKLGKPRNPSQKHKERPASKGRVHKGRTRT